MPWPSPANPYSCIPPMASLSPSAPVIAACYAPSPSSAPHGNPSTLTNDRRHHASQPPGTSRPDNLTENSPENGPDRLNTRAEPHQPIGYISCRPVPPSAADWRNKRGSNDLGPVLDLSKTGP